MADRHARDTMVWQELLRGPKNVATTAFDAMRPLNQASGAALRILEAALQGHDLNEAGRRGWQEETSFADLLNEMDKAGRIPAPLKTAAGLFGDVLMPGPGELGALGHAAPAALVYHGTPHRFAPTPRNPLGEFDMSKIGTGEGAQAYGHGIYLAEHPDVAKSYVPRDETYEKSLLELFQRAERAQNYDAARVFEDAMLHRTIPELRARYPSGPSAQAVNQVAKIPFTTGGLYRVDLPDDQIARMLDWDAPLARQPESVRGALRESGLARRLRSAQSDFSLHQTTKGNRGRNLYSMLEETLGSQSAASSALGSAGVPGLRYWDQGSRAAGSGTRNYVVWQPEILRILGIE